ncbi:MAG: hypothetical protein D6805_07160 [Planctomycetota bacterium]|nr:MAG: hypothetical protein D6805_07160 [Planctomycetota bacterium]
MKYQIVVQRKPGVFDPEMATLQRHLQNQGIGPLHIQQTHIYEIQFTTPSPRQQQWVREIAENFLTHPELHTYQIHSLDPSHGENKTEHRHH